MQLVRKHQLDDPRMTDEVRGILVQAAIERRRGGSVWKCRARSPTAVSANVR